jgi:hypothetical protein
MFPISSVGLSSKKQFEAIRRIERKMRKARRKSSIIISLWTASSMILIGFNHANNLGFPAYMTSYLGNPLDPEAFYWLIYVSFTIQIYGMSISILTFTHFHFICLGFSNSIGSALEYISFEAGSRSRPTAADNIFLVASKSTSEIEWNSKENNWISNLGVGPDPIDIKTACAKFQMLKELVGSFNSIYRWMFIFYKTSILIQYCILFYVPMRYLSEVPFSSILIFIVSGLFFSIQLSSLLPAMAKVFSLSKAFKGTWLQSFPNLTYVENSDQFYTLNMQMQILGKCTEFGFEAGRFYIVKSGTILTFFSIATSYLIVLLQL